MKLSSVLSSSFVFAAVAASSALATEFNFSPSSAAAGNVGPSESYTQDGYTITAYGFVTATGLATDLYQKFTVGQSWETGLGVAADSDHEIPANFFVQLDLQNLITAGFTSVSLKFGSLQAWEKANVYTDSTAGTLGDGSLVSTLTGLPLEQWVTLDLTTRYFDVTGGGTSGGADPVLQVLSVTHGVPDSGSTIVLLGAALVGCGALSKRRFSRLNRKNA